MKSFLSILRRYPLAMIMNFIGLILGFTAFMVLMVQVSYQAGFDRNHPTSGRIFRVDKVGIDRDDVFRTILPRGYADDIIGCSAHIEAGSITCPFIGSVIFNVEQQDSRAHESFKSTINIVYPEFFKVFGAEFAQGSADALEDTRTVAIPLSLSEKLFGKDPALGKVLHYNEQNLFGDDRGQEMIIGAVYKDFPRNSQIGNDIYINVGDINKGSYGGANFNCYLLLDSADNKEAVERDFNTTMDYGDSDWLTEIELTPVESIYYADAGNTLYKTGSRSQMWILICISILVLLIGGINYTTFFTALAPMRVKNINTRKVLGSGNSSLRAGLILEAVLFSLAAYTLALLAIPYISSLLCSEGLLDMPFRFGGQKLLILTSALTALMIGLAAGLFPSIFVTSVPAAFALKGDMQYSLSGKRFRTVMMVLQYTVSFVLLVFVISIYRQNKYMLASDNGFDQDKVAVVKISQTQYAKSADWLKGRLSSLAEVEDVAFAQECMGSGDVYNTTTFDYNGKPIRSFIIYCSPNFLDVMGIGIEQGRNFPQTFKTKGSGIINRAFADLGGDIEMGSKVDGLEIIGQTGQLRINSLRQDISPICYIALPHGSLPMTYTYIRLADGFDRRECVEKIEGVLKELDPGYLFEVKLYDNILGELYSPEIKQEKVVSLFALLAALLSLIGIFGQVLLDLQYSRRNIAIRKVFGADNSPLVRDALMSYCKKIALSFILAAPIAWVLAGRWQQNFVCRVGLNGAEFALAFALISLLTLGIVAVMSLKAVRANPVETLRKE